MHEGRNINRNHGNGNFIMKKSRKNVFLFVTANKHERDAFEKKFIRQKEQYILGKTYYLGMFGHYPAAYIHMDEQGPTNPAAIPLVSQLVQELQPVAVVMVGIAFGVDEKKQKIGDVLISDKILPYDSQKLLEDKTEYKETPKEVGFQLLNAFREHREWVYYLANSEQSTVYIGAMLTGSRLINNYKYRNQLLDDFSDQKPIGGEMEAQGIYSMCRIHGVSEWIIIKGICDWGYNKNTPNKHENQVIAANTAVDYCFYVFSREGVFDSLFCEDSSVKTSLKKYAANTGLKFAVNNYGNEANMRDSNNNSNKYGVQNNRNVTHQIILNIESMSGSISPPQSESEGRPGSRVRKDNPKQRQGNGKTGAIGNQGRNVPLNISVNLYATSSNGRTYTNHFSRSGNHNFGVEVRIQNSNSCAYDFSIAGCVYDSNGAEIFRWRRTKKRVPPSNSPERNDFWVDRNKFLAMRDGEYRVQFWINDVKVEKMFFTVSQ